MMVLLTAYLNEGVPPVGEDSEMSDRKMEFWSVVREELVAKQGGNKR